jgi:HK97 family phage portal protein
MALLPRLFGRKPAPQVQQKAALMQVDDRSWTRIFDWLPGKWQQHEPLDREGSVVSHPTVFACLTRIATDIAKLPPMTQRYNSGTGVWSNVLLPRFMDLLLKPNQYQTHIEFKENWLYSKLIHGNTYVLKQRNSEGRIVGMTILDPTRVQPLVSDDGDIFYRLDSDNLTRITSEQITVPADEVIHDRMCALFHPLVGLSPLYAAAVVANGGLAIQRDSTQFFENGAKPSAILTAPGPISENTAQQIKDYWSQKFSGANSGNVAVLGDGLKYDGARMSAVDAQLIDQLNFSAETICSAYHVPPHMVGVGPMPTHDNIEAQTQAYYSNCLQVHIEKMELLLARDLMMPEGVRVELDLDRLIRTDRTRRIDILAKGVAGAIMKPNEARQDLNLPPIIGGDTVYLQQQNYSLEALDARDRTNPLAAPEPAPPEPDDDEVDDDELERALADLRKLAKAFPAGDFARAAA